MSTSGNAPVVKIQDNLIGIYHLSITLFVMFAFGCFCSNHFYSESN